MTPRGAAALRVKAPDSFGQPRTCLRYAPILVTLRMLWNSKSENRASRSGDTEGAVRCQDEQSATAFRESVR